ncbi:hypothetical protein RB595_000238 [Gaeumannomyces hyphopodioides]
MKLSVGRSACMLLVLPVVVGAASVVGHPLLVQRQDDDCRLPMETYLWTTCSSFLADYNITLPELLRLNPLVGVDCSGFVPGSTYCLRKERVLPPSTDGTCGHLNRNVTCVGSTFGDCCGRQGTCGRAQNFCLPGFCQGGICPGLGYSTNGRCGEDNDFLMCGGPFGKCCSASGRCGSTLAECGAGCQSGDCVGNLPSSSTTTTSTTPPTPLPSPGSPSPDGTCGYVNKFKCTGTEPMYYGYCCNSAGYCGFSEWDCSPVAGCQAEFGRCDETVIVTVSGTAPVATSATN